MALRYINPYSGVGSKYSAGLDSVVAVIEPLYPNQTLDDIVNSVYTYVTTTKELTKVQYVNLIQLVAGVNPTGPSYGAYIGNPKLPSLACAQNFTPCYRDPGLGVFAKFSTIKNVAF